MPRPRKVPAKTYSDELETIQDVRAAYSLHLEELKKLISHANKLQEEYSDWQSRFYDLEKAIEAMAQQHGMRAEVLTKAQSDDPLEDMGIDIE